MRTTYLIAIILMFHLDLSSSHGYLDWPPQRSSLWRYGHDTPINYDDNGLFCGGIKYFRKTGGICGTCGDPLHGPHEHLAGGKYASGIIGVGYPKGIRTIKTMVNLDAYHMGYFEFRICPHNNPKVVVQQSCLDKHPLQIKEGDEMSDFKRFYPKHGGPTELTVVIPQGMTCSQCVLQWRYVAGNSWGIGKDGKGCLGCGIQENFQNCADISIGHRVFNYDERLGSLNDLRISKQNVLSHDISRHAHKHHSKHRDWRKKMSLKLDPIKISEIQKETRQLQEKKKPQKRKINKLRTVSSALSRRRKKIIRKRGKFVLTVEKNQVYPNDEVRPSASARSTKPYTMTFLLRASKGKREPRVLTKFFIGRAKELSDHGKNEAENLKKTFLPVLMKRLRGTLNSRKTGKSSRYSITSLIAALEEVLPPMLDKVDICDIASELCDDDDK